MRTDEWQQVEALLSAALEVEPGARGEFLDEACAGAPELRREVESLLACEEGAGGFLGAPALALSADFFDGDAPEDRTGQTVGHYRILREIGRGGMGTVFLAERADGEFKQEVALKVVRRSLADPELARRFRREREILAPLNHPNIARLLDGGVSADGEPFIAMEYVEGVRVDDYCDARHFTARERLRLLIEVCRGVAYAHQHLVVHRDIKPSNILVTKEGTPKLLDFGIAKLLDPVQAGEQTRTELRAFTPDYASPEQVSGGQVTTASDVYSLGVLLGDLLRGAGAGRHARRAPGGWRSRGAGATAATSLPTADEGRRQGAQPPTQTFVNAELKNIVRMARHEDPARRYASAAQLAEDVQRYLDGLPVRAQKDSFTYRAGKFVRRNRAGVAAAALVALSLVVGFAVAIWQAGVARRERDRAERRFGDVRRLSNAMLTEIAPKIERLQGSTDARRALVNQSLTYLDSLAREAGDDPALQSELASAYEQVGDLQGAPRKPNLSDFKGAAASYGKAQAIRRRLLEKSPGDPEARRLLAANHRGLSEIRFWMKDIAGSLAESEASMALYRQLVAEQPGSVALRVALADALKEHAGILYEKQEYAGSYPYLRDALESLEEARRATPDDVEVLRLVSECRSLYGIALSWDGRQAEGEAETAKALAVIEPLVEAHPNDVVLRQRLWTTYLRASSLYEDTDDALVESFALKALGLAAESVERDPADTQARQNLATSHSRLAAGYGRTKKFVLAVLHAEKSLALYAELERGEPDSTTYKRGIGMTYTRLGDVKYQQRDLRGALDAFEKSAESFEKVVRADAQNTNSLRDIAQACKNLGWIHDDLAAAAATGQERHEHLRAARQNYQRALDILAQLKAQGGFAGVDQKIFDEMKAAIEKHGQE